MLPHDAGPHFESPTHGKSQQTFGEAPYGRPKIRPQESSRGISRLLFRAPGRQGDTCKGHGEAPPESMPPLEQDPQ